MPSCLGNHLSNSCCQFWITLIGQIMSALLERVTRKKISVNAITWNLYSVVKSWFKTPTWIDLPSPMECARMQPKPAFGLNSFRDSITLSYLEKIGSKYLLIWLQISKLHKNSDNLDLKAPKTLQKTYMNRIPPSWCGCKIVVKCLETKTSGSPFGLPSLTNNKPSAVTSILSRVSSVRFSRLTRCSSWCCGDVN